MPSTITDRLNGLTTSVAVKAPCRVATTVPITLSGYQVIDGVTVSTRDRVLVKDQAGPIDNGIYAASAGAWRRTPDFDGSLDAAGGTLILVTEGSINANSFWQIDGYGAIVIGHDDIAFEATSGNLSLQADLESPTGATHVGFQQTGAGSIPSTVAAKLKQFLPTASDKGAPTNGITDARAALILADAAGPFQLTQGLYYVSSSVTLNNLYYVAPGARLVIPSGVIVTTPNLDAGEYQIVNLTGTGNLGGLKTAKLMWFAGDILNADTNAEPAIQKAYDACIAPAGVLDARGLVEWPIGTFYSDGVGINVTKGQRTVGAGKKSSLLMFRTSATNGLICSTTEGPIFEHIGMNMQSPNTIATSGVQVWFSGASLNGYIQNCELKAGYIAKRWTGVNGGKSLNVDVIDAMASADYIDGASAIVLSDGIASAFSDFCDLSTTVGFLPGESITWTGGSGSFGYATSGTRAKIIINDVHPPVSGTITGATSGAAATLSALYIGHALGGLRITGNSPAFIVRGNEYAGGVYAWITDATVNAHGSRPEYGQIIANYFDHSDGGAILDKLSGTNISENWFSSRLGEGCTLMASTHCDLIGNKFASSWGAGLFIGAASISTKVLGGFAAGNNRSNNSKDGIHVEAGTTDFVITGVRAGGTTAAGFDGTQRSGINIEIGASDRYVIEQNLVSGNTVVGVYDGGTGINKSVARNF